MSYTYCFFHVVFRTKHSAKAIPQTHERELYELIWRFCESKGVRLRRINGMEEHLHLGVELPPTYAVADFVRDVKKYTSAVLKTNPHFPHFNGWAEGYCALGYCIDAVPKVLQYIRTQKEHHSGVSFQTEMDEMVQLTGIEINEEYFQKAWVE